MKKTVLFCIVCISVIQGCTTFAPSKEYYLDLDKEEVYFNSFINSGDIFWVGNDGIQKAEINNGEYYFEALTENGSQNAPHFDINPNSNFEIEMSITGPENDTIGFYGMALGELKNDSTFIEFKVNNLGSFVVLSQYPIIEGKYTISNKDSYKKLTIRKIERDFSFFINEELKYTYPIDELFNLRAGPITNNNSAVWVDYFKLSKIKQRIENLKE